MFDTAAALEANKGTGLWQVCEIEMAGHEMSVRLNGVPISRAEAVANPRGGYIGFHAGAGAIEIRAVSIQDPMGEHR